MSGTRTIGSTLTLVKAGAEPTDTSLAHLTSIGETGGEHEEVDVTTLDSPGGAKEFIAGATDYGSFDVVGNVIDGVQPATMYELFKTRAVRDWKIQTPAGTILEVEAYMSAFKWGEKTVDGLDSFTLTLRVSGEPTYTSGDPES